MSEPSWIEHHGGKGPHRYDDEGKLVHDPQVTIRIRALDRSTVLAKDNRYRASSLKWQHGRSISPGDIVEFIVR